MPEIFQPRINPALHRYPAEASLIGRIVVAFGELEYIVAICAGWAIKDRDRALRALYRLRATSARIDVADAFIRPTFDGTAFEPDYRAAIAAIRYCLKIRNQYAHCNWSDAPDHGLFFTDLQESADAEKGFEIRWYHIDAPLLIWQEQFFVYAQSYLYFIESQLSIIAGRPIYPAPPKPLELALPPLHNPPAQHVPPWLDADQKAQHLARALAAQGGAPTPTLGQRAQDQARAEKRARQAEQRRKSREADRNAKERSDPAR